MSEPKANSFAEELKAAVLEGVRSVEIDPTYSHDEVSSAMNDIVNNSETSPTE